jgi:pimeloyl-ACP methyl ester carboxylesterase
VANAISINGLRIELIERGQGRPLLFLHPAIGIEPDAPVLAHLADHARVIAPIHPGFGGSDAPKWFDSVDDLAYFYLDLLEALDLKDVVLVGVSFGGWIAAEIAVKSTAQISHLVLGNPVGIKVGSREHPDIADFFAMEEADFIAIAYHDPSAATRDYKTMPDGELRNVAQNREATARYGWSPFMHDPKLKNRLHRIRIPTLFIWGVHDRVLSESYGKAYCAAIAGARFERLERAGHFPHLEQPREFAEKVVAFAAGR